MAGKPVTLIELGVKPKVVSVGGVVSVVEVTESVVGNPLATRSEVASTNVLQTVSDTNTAVTVHVPASLNRGKLSTIESFTVVFGVKLLVATWVELPEGLTKTAWKKLTHERSSVRVKLAVTLADAAVVSIVAGVKLKAVMFGGVVSAVEETCRAVVKPAAARPLLSRNSVLPAASEINTYARFQVPEVLNRGKLMATESVIDALGLKLLDARGPKLPKGSKNAVSK